MAITGIDTIDGKQIIAAGAVSAKSAEMAYNDENGNPITGYQVAGDYYSASNPSGFITGVDLTPYQTTAGMTAYQSAGDYYSASNPSGFITGLPEEEEVEFEEIDLTDYQPVSAMTAYTNSADVTGTAQYGLTTAGWSEITAGGSAPTYDYTDNDLISAIDSSGLYATSALEAKSANAVKDKGTLGSDLSSYLSQNTSYFYWMPANSPWTTADYATGIFSPLQYATGACLAMNNPATFKGYYKGNEWFIANTVNNVGQMLRGEVHRTRGVHISGATTAGYDFDLNISGVSGKNDTANNYNWILQRGYVSGKGAYGEWYYGHAEDAALRTVSSCDMHESAFEYDANDKISGYNGSAFAGGSDVPEGVMVESGLEYNAVNEISGYNGSAIAQYGAEKQWLVHDDTLVHASNSAQYALGVNLSAVAQLLGVDETVLYSGTQTYSAVLSESVKNFDKILIEYGPNNYSNVPAVTFFTDKFVDNNAIGGGVHLEFVEHNGTNAYCFPKTTTFVWHNNCTNLDAIGGLQYRVSGNAIQNEVTGNQLYIRKIIGIGRKQ